jgi:hypothetical protein
MMSTPSRLRSRTLSVLAITADVSTSLSLVLLLIALTGTFPFSGTYASPIGDVKIGPKPAIWIALFVLSVLARITLRKEGGRVSRLLTHSTPVRLFLIALLIYNANGRLMGAVDTTPAQYIPFTLLREFNFDFDEFAFLFREGVPAYLVFTGNHYVSLFPPFAGIVAAPIYLFSVWSGMDPASRVVADLQKLSAAIIAAMTVAFLYATLKRLTSERISLLIAIVFAFGTSTFTIAAQALWQHGPSELFLTLSLYCLVRGLTERKYSGYAGLFVAAAVLCRYTNVLIALPLTVYILHRERDQMGRFILSALPAALFLAWYNWYHFGSVLTTPYSRTVTSETDWYPILEGLAARLVSPNRGLLIYSPVFLFSILGIYRIWREKEQLLLKYISMGLVLNFIWYSIWPVWRDEWAFGPRYLTDLAPLLSLFLIPSYELIQPTKPLKWAFVFLCTLSVSIHFLGAFFSGGWNPDVGSKHRRVWSLSDGQLVYSVRKLIFKTSGKLAPLDHPSVRIALDKLDFKPSDTVEIKVSIDPGTGRESVDCYLVLTTPEGKVQFLTGDSTSSTPTFLLSSQSLSARLNTIAQYKLAQAMPTGKYKVDSFLFRTGTLFDLRPEAAGRIFEGQGVEFFLLPTTK